jgi:hypothetical protein
LKNIDTIGGTLLSQYPEIDWKGAMGFRDQGWHAFLRMLAYKMTWAGGVLKLVPPHYNLADLPGVRARLEGQPPVTGGVSVRGVRF